MSGRLTARTAGHGGYRTVTEWRAVARRFPGVAYRCVRIMLPSPRPRPAGHPRRSHTAGAFGQRANAACLDHRRAVAGGRLPRRLPRTRNCRPCCDPFLSQHEQHLAQLQGRLVVPPHVKVTPLPSPPAPGGPGRFPRAAVTCGCGGGAAAGQRDGSHDTRRGPVLASIAASEATHAVALASAGPASPRAEATRAVPPRGRRGGLPRPSRRCRSVLAAENAAVYGYGLAGAQLSGSQLRPCSRTGPCTGWPARRCRR